MTASSLSSLTLPISKAYRSRSKAELTYWPMLQTRLHGVDQMLVIQAMINQAYSDDSHI